MKLSDLFEAVDLSKKGTYAFASLDAESRKVISEYIKDNDIPNPTKTDKLHCTLIYSRVEVPDMKSKGDYKPPMVCKPKGLEIWKAQPDEDGNTKNCLVLKLSCPEFTARHKELMDKHPKATYDYPEFKVHVTLSYDIGDKKLKDFPDIKQELRLEKETVQELESGWAKKNSKKSKT